MARKAKPQPPPAPESALSSLEASEAARRKPVTITAGQLDAIVGENYGRDFYGGATTALNACCHVACELRVVMHALRDDGVAGSPDIENTLYLLAERLEAAADISAAEIIREREGSSDAR